LETKFESITVRIKEFNKESCAICLEDYTDTTPGIVPCCNNLFCVPCLTQVKGNCPFCREKFTMDKVHVIMENTKKKNNKDNNNKSLKEITKMDALIKLIKDKPNGKFLLFSNYDQTFDNLNQRLNEENIVFSKVMGSGAVVNKIIDRFTKGEIRVLMLNAINYGSGLNLQMASDIIIYHQLSLELETQVIGRAQRIGRTEPLNVYYLIHDHETNNVTNPTLSLDLSIEEDINKLDVYLGKEIEPRSVEPTKNVTKVIEVKTENIENIETTIKAKEKKTINVKTTRVKKSVINV
jgi:hypothetical protein